MRGEAMQMTGVRRWVLGDGCWVLDEVFGEVVSA